MSAETVARIIQIIIAPAVMISACALTLNGFLARYTALNNRLRVMNGERLTLLQKLNDDALTAERLQLIVMQLPNLLRRHRYQHDAVLLYTAILAYIASMFVIAVASFMGFAWAAGGALAIFITATAFFLTAIAMTIMEVRLSHIAVRLETEQTTLLHRRLTGDMLPKR